MSAIRSVAAPEIKARIQREAPQDAWWVFDCDGTLIRGDIASLTAWSLIRFELAHQELLPPEWAEFKVQQPFDYAAFKRLRNIIVSRKGTNAIYEWEAFLHAGLPSATSLDMARFSVAEGLKTGAMAFTGAVSELAQENAARTWIVSGSPDVCVWAVGEKLGVPQERVLGTRLESVDGIYAPRIKAPGIIWEDLKRVILAEHKIPTPYFVAGDTIGDWQMMETATHWCWCVMWGVHRHRGEEFREKIQQHVLASNGSTLPQDPGLYVFEAKGRNWVFEIRGPG